MTDPTAAAERPADGQLRHLHPLTPLLRGWALLVGLAAIFGQDAIRSLDLKAMALAVAAAVPVVGAYGWLAWRATRYGIVGGDLRHEQGVLFRRSRRIRLDRLQAVDVVRPLVARALGLAELRLEVAGGSAPEAPLAYLSERDAVALRAQLLARAAGLSDDTPEAPERVLHRVPPVRLALSLLLVPGTLVALLAAVALAVFVLVTRQWAVALPFGTAVVGLLGVPVRRFATAFDFTLAESPDGLRIRQGLLETRAQTVPPGRVQAVRVVRPLLWRLSGDWGAVEVNVAGYAGASSGASVLLPVAPAPVVREVLARVLPGVDLGSVRLRGVPRRARLVDPLVWRRLAAGADATVFVARRGLLREETDVLAHAKPQSVRITQGPLQRRAGLASVHLDTTPGPVRVHAAHRDDAEAWPLLNDQVERSRRARAAAVGERWMTVSSHSTAADPPAP